MKQMVDITDKKKTYRYAKAKSELMASKEVIKRIKEDKLKKGNVFETAKLSGINAVKKTPESIIYTHPIKITAIDFNFEIKEESIYIICEVRADDRTGVEMEALTGAVTAALNIYDMIKSIDKSAKITNVQLMEKSGGKSGDYKREINE